MHHFIAICEFKLEIQSRMPNLGRNRWYFLAVWPWNLTDDLENQKGTVLNNIKLSASFHHHMWNQIGVMVLKRLIWVLTSLTLTFDLWPWTFAQTSLLLLVISPENFMTIPWWEHSEKGVTAEWQSNFLKGKSIWKCYLQNFGHFFQA